MKITNAATHELKKVVPRDNFLRIEVTGDKYNGYMYNMFPSRNKFDGDIVEKVRDLEIVLSLSSYLQLQDSTVDFDPTQKEILIELEQYDDNW